MVATLSVDELQELRNELVSVIADKPEALILDDTVDYSTVLELVRTSGRTNLLRVAFEKAKKLDEVEQTTAWIEILNAVETEISIANTPSEDAADSQSQQEHQQEQYQ